MQFPRLDEFDNGAYHICVYGPNGFFREFVGLASASLLKMEFGHMHAPNSDDLSGDVQISIEPHTRQELVEFEIEDLGYGTGTNRNVAKAGTVNQYRIASSKSFGWYDFVIRTSDRQFQQRYAGRVETGRWSMSDPQLGG
jgi:phospholipase C